MCHKSQVTGLPAAFIRKKPKEYGTCRYAEGASFDSKRFVLVEDVVSSGGVEALATLNLPLVALYTFSQVENA